MIAISQAEIKIKNQLTNNLRAASAAEDKMKIIGVTEYIKIGENPHEVPAKIDTGADSTTVFAKILQTPEETELKVLKFALFCEESEFYDGHIYETTEYREVKIRSSNGAAEKRYKVLLPVTICGESFVTEVSLSDRSKNTYPVLVGRKTLAGRFLVNPAIKKVDLEMKKIILEN